MPSRRSVLASAVGVGAAALLSGCRGAPGTAPGSSPSATVGVDFGRTDYFPLLKSKISVGRALETTEILDSLPYLDQIRPAAYDAEIRFPDTDWPSLTPYPFEAGSGGRARVLRNGFLESFFGGLRERGIEILPQLEGAPRQWWDYAEAKAPHNFPVPTDLPAAAGAVGQWAGLYSGYPISWCIWNEPSHNLLGAANRASVRQMLDVYEAYTRAITSAAASASSASSASSAAGGTSRGRLFGLASFIPPNATPSPRLGGQTYVGAVLDELRRRRAADPGLPFDYLTMNNYGEKLHPLLDAARDALGSDFNTVPLVQAQFGVFPPHVWEKSGGTSLEAARSMAALDEALRVADLQVFTFSGWIPHLIAYRGGKALPLPLFNALKLYARMPDPRATVHGRPPSGLGIMASGDEYRSSVLLWNETNEPRTVALDLSGVAGAGTGQQGAELRVYYIDSEHGSPLEHGGSGEFGAGETTSLAAASSRSLTKTVTVAGPGIAYLEIGSAGRHPVLDRTGLAATLVRKHSYADRTTAAATTATATGTAPAAATAGWPARRTSVRGSAYGCFDAVRAIAYLGVEGDRGTALTGAEYRGLPDTLGLGIRAELAAGGRSAVPQALFGVRVDYLLGSGEPVRSVLWHGDILEGRRTEPLPWGRGGPTADVLVRTPALDRAGTADRRLDLALAEHAPSGWSGAGRQAILSFWMDSPGPRSQARFLLG